MTVGDTSQPSLARCPHCHHRSPIAHHHSPSFHPTPDPSDAWWRVEELEELRGNVLVESASGSYVIALDDGTLTVSGEPAAEVPGPTAQEVLTISAVSAARVSLKSAFNRYFSVHPDAENGSVTARQEAVGTMELFEPVARDDVSFKETYEHGAAHHLVFFFSYAHDLLWAQQKRVYVQQISTKPAQPLFVHRELGRFAGRTKSS